jgi:hypothetical protein
MKRLFLLVLLCVSSLQAQLDSLIVTAVGPYQITADDLQTSYEFGPAFVKRRPDALREHLKYMIYERLLALEAEQNGLKRAEFVQRRIQALEEDGAIEQLYRQDILSQVKLSEKQIANDTRKAKITLRLRWIYTRTKKEAEKVHDHIFAGASFDSVYARQKDSSDSAESRSLETTLLKLERDKADLADAVSRMKVGTVALPVQGKDGYYLFRLDEARQNPLTTETDYTELRNQAIEIRTKVIADGLADQYVKNMMSQHNPVIKAEGFNILRAYLGDKGLSHDTKVKWAIPSTFMTEAGPQPIENAAKYLGRPLVTFGKRTMTIRDYAQWYDIRQFQFDTHSLEAFNSSVKKTIWKMVQDKLLSEEAYRRGFDRHPFVANETKKWEAKILYLAERAAIARTISATDSVLQNYYRVHKKKYTDRQGKLKDFLSVRESVKGDYAAEEESLALLRSIESMKQKIPVTINEILLQRLLRETDYDPRAMEAVFYKPGGSFPRVAFPTIDETWSTLR